MAIFKVIEQRMITFEYIIETDSKEKAEQLDGDFKSEDEIANIGYDLVSCEEIGEIE